MIDWTHWHTEPLLTGALVLIAWAYALGVGPWRQRLHGSRFPSGHVLVFAAGLAVFYLAVGSPLDQIGERYLFSAHMVQHMLIVYLVAPLVIAGLPPWLIDSVFGRTRTAGLWRMLTRPAVAAPVYALVLSFWHVPAAYDFALRDKSVHVIQHLVFFAVAFVLWWPLLSPSKLVPRSQPGVQILYLVAVGGLQMPLIAFLAFSRNVLFPTYEFAPRITSLTALEDQVLGGAIMGVSGMFISLGLIIWIFARWYRQSTNDVPHEPAGQPT